LSAGASAAGVLPKRREPGILRGDPDLGDIDLVPSAGIGGEQRLVGEDVDAPGKSLGDFGNQVDGLPVKGLGP
jgi:hypothetical protein